MWGTNHKTKKVSDSPEAWAVVRYRYFSLMFVLSFVWQRKWFLQFRDRAYDRESSAAEIAQLFGPDAVPQPPAWRRFGMLSLAGAFVGLTMVLAVLGAILGDRDSTTNTAVGEIADEPAGPEADDVSIPPEAAAGTGDEDAAVIEAGDSPDDGSDALADPALLATGTVTMTSADNLVTPNKPDQYRTRLFVDRVFATSDYEDRSAPENQKLVVVEFHMIGAESTGSMISPATFRLDAAGRSFTPISSIDPVNSTLIEGMVLNDVLVFVVPADVMAFTVEAGPASADGDGGGAVATFDVALTDDLGATAHLADQVAVTDAELEAVASSTVLTSGDATVTGTPMSPGMGRGLVEILKVATTAIHDGEPSGPRDKFVVVDWCITWTEGTGGAIQPAALRLIAEGEPYSPINLVNEMVPAGESAEFRLVYRVPRTATDLILQAGALPSAEDGSWGEFTVSFD